MNYLKFTKKEKVNFKLIDNQHKDFINLVNKLFDASNQNNYNEVNSLMKELVGFLKLHFSTEEKLMIETKYEGYYSHKLEHDRYLRTFIKLQNDFLNKNILPTIDFFEGIKNWFTNHLEMNDKKMSDYFVKLGIK
ncbi:MAG: bacteriohemerythrin [Stygiobacter sp.]